MALLAVCISSCATNPAATGSSDGSSSSAISGEKACKDEAGIGYNPCYAPGTIRVARKQVFTFRAKFEAEAKKARVQQTAFDSTLIGVAIAGVVESFLRAPVDVVGTTAIGGAGLGAYRTYYDPAGEGLVYLKAKTALNCILDQSQVLLSANTAAVIKAINDTQHLAGDTKAAKQAEEIESESTQILTTLSAHLTDAIGSATSATKAAIVAATASGNTQMQAAASSQETATNTAIDAAQSAQRVLKNEVAAYILAPTAIWSSLNKVIHFVDMSTRRTAPATSAVQSDLINAINQQSQSTADTLTARKQLYNALTQQGTAAAQQARAGTSAQSAQAAQKVTDLNGATKQALENMPNPLYSTVVTSIQACAAGM